MNISSSQYRVQQCSKCPKDREYYCESCLRDLCPQCKEHHVNNLKSIDHNVILRKKYYYMPIQEVCVTHPGKAYIKYCERCELPVCDRCKQHRSHRQTAVKKSI